MQNKHVIREVSYLPNLVNQKVFLLVGKLSRTIMFILDKSNLIMKCNEHSYSECSLKKKLCDVMLSVSRILQLIGMRKYEICARH